MRLIAALALSLLSLGAVAQSVTQSVPPKIQTRPAGDNSSFAASTGYVDSSAQAIASAIAAQRGAPNGIATLGPGGTLPLAQFPSANTVTPVPSGRKAVEQGDASDLAIATPKPSSDRSSGLASTSWVRAYGAGYANVLSCLSSAQIADVIGNAGSIDLTSTLQPCLTSLGSVTVLWPAGTYRILGTLTPPNGQDNQGVGDGWNAGSVILVPAATSVPTFKLQSSIKVKGFSFIGSTSATDGQSFVQINNVNGATVANNFFTGGFAQVDVVGTSFYAHIENNKLALRHLGLF